MRIREQLEIASADDLDQRADAAAAIRELEQQYERGEIETHAYFLKKRALVRML